MEHLKRLGVGIAVLLACGLVIACFVWLMSGYDNLPENVRATVIIAILVVGAYFTGSGILSAARQK